MEGGAGRFVSEDGLTNPTNPANPAHPAGGFPTMSTVEASMLGPCPLWNCEPSSSVRYLGSWPEVHHHNSVKLQPPMFVRTNFGSRTTGSWLLFFNSLLLYLASLLSCSFSKPTASLHGAWFTQFPHCWQCSFALQTVPKIRRGSAPVQWPPTIYWISWTIADLRVLTGLLILHVY